MTVLRPVLILWMLSAALFAVHPAAGGLLLMASVFKYPHLYREAGHRVQSSESLGTYGLAIALLVFAVQWLMLPPAPSDDLLRHIPAHAYGYVHSAIFPHSSLPAYSLYPAFEHGVGALAQAWGPLVTVQVVMAAAWLSAVLLVVGLARQAGAGLSAGTSVLICLLFATALSERLFLGRPEVFGVLWGVAALLCRGRIALLTWVLGGVLLSSSYWLFPLYLVFVLLLPHSWKARIAAGAVLLGYHFAFWTWNAGGLATYLQVLGMIPVWTNARLLTVLETQSIWQMFARPSMVILTALGLTGLVRMEPRRRLMLVTVGIAFLMTNMVRYAAVLALLLFVAALPLVEDLNAFVRRHLAAALVVLLLPLLSVGVVRQAAPTFGQLPHFTLPAGAKVLTAFDTATFALPFFNPGRVQIIPAMEIGATEKPYQQASRNLYFGNLTCKDLEGLNLTHVVERTQQSIPQCLKLTKVQGEWRLWEVAHGQ